MGIKNSIANLGRKGRIKDRCDKDPETGEVVCKRVRVHQDGTQEDIAGFSVNVDANCNPVATSSFENEDGGLDALERKSLSRIVGKCKNLPADY